MSITKEAICKRPDHLPPKLIQLSFKKRNLLHYTTSPGTAKSWLNTTRRCNASVEQRQWPQLYHLNNSSNKSSTLSYPNSHFLGDSDFLFVSRRPNSSYWCILKADTTFRVSPTSKLSSKVALNYVKPRAVHAKLGGVCSPALMVFYLDCNGNYVWIRHECEVVDPFDAKKMCVQFTSIVHSQGKFHALSLQGTLVEMQNVDSCLRITGISSSRGVPSVSSKFFKEYLLDLNGEILLVFLIYQKSIKIVDLVQVFRLDFVKFEWMKVERLRGKTLFLDQSCIWANSAEIGCRENCVYFTQASVNRWWIYDMETRCISPA